MIKLSQAIIVEGKYDKIRLSGFIDAVIVETDGFRIFSDRENKAFIKRLAVTKGIIIMTDSDAAGFRIRDYIVNICGGNNVVNAYIPDVYGREKRKNVPSKEGKIGVEGLSEDIINESLHKAGVVLTDDNVATSEIDINGDSGETIRKVTVTDLYEDGFTGRENSKERRYDLLTYLGLPKRLSNSQMIKVINTFMTYSDYKKAVNDMTSINRHCRTSNNV